MIGELEPNRGDYFGKFTTCGTLNFFVSAPRDFEIVSFCYKLGPKGAWPSDKIFTPGSSKGNT